MKQLLQLLPLLRPYRTALIAGAVIAVANNAIGAVGPWLLKLAVDALQRGTTARELALYAALIVAVAAAAGVFRYYMRKILIGVSRHVELDLRNRVFAHLQTLPAAYYNRKRTGDLMARVTSDLDSVRTVLGPGIMYPLDTFSMAVFVLTMMALISPRLTAVVLLAAPVVSLTVYYLGRITYRLHTRIQEQFSTLSARAQENLAGARVVRSFAQEEREVETFRELNREYLRRNLAMVRVQALFMPAMFLLFEIGAAMILLVGGWGIIQNRISLGDFVAFVGYLGMLAWPIIAVGWVANLFQRGAASMARVSEILDTVPDIAPPLQAQIPAAIRGEIEFRGVDFSYGSGAALQDLNFTIQAGSTVAIVGRTASGKTSLVSLIPRLFDPTRGDVLIDGVSTRAWDLQALRAAVGMVPQDALLFSETLRANIEFGVAETTADDLARVTEIAQIDRDVAEFRDGYETLVGERGVTLSGGQKGRAALARALIKDPAILILDDALAAVDTRTEEQILRGLRTYMRNRTAIIISHRVSTVRDADEIFVLDRGRIVERGTHDELIRRGGYYTELERMQRLEAELEALDADQ